MTTEKLQEKHKYNSRKNNCSMKKKRKWRQRMKLLVYAGLLFLFGVVGFHMGKSIHKQKVQASEIFDVLIEGEDEITYTKEKIPEISEAVPEEKILLVNKEHGLPEDYDVKLRLLPDGVNYAATEAYQPLCDMLEAGRQEGLHFVICSSYRDTERQRELFDEDVATLMQAGYSYREAYEEVARETMPPGHSEHSTGLAFDIVAADYQMLDAGQARTAENKWLRKHCAEFGFILRYPEGKEQITAVNYESWHFRYVGEEAAKYIMEEEITLEEYLGM